MKDKLQNTFATFAMINLKIFIFVGVVLIIFLFFILCACFIDMSFQPAIDLYNNLRYYSSGKILRLILAIYVFVYLGMRFRIFEIKK